VSPDILKARKEQLFLTFSREIEALEEFPTDKLIKTLSEVIPGEFLNKLNQEGAFQDVEQKFRLLDKIIGNEFTNRVIMPGLITGTNANSIEGNQATWNVEIAQFLFSDFEMWVESRRVNSWAVMVAGGVFVVIVVILFAGALRIKGKRKKNK
jgi:hypothetical protein